MFRIDKIKSLKLIIVYLTNFALGLKLFFNIDVIHSITKI